MNMADMTSQLLGISGAYAQNMLSTYRRLIGTNNTTHSTTHINLTAVYAVSICKAHTHVIQTYTPELIEDKLTAGLGGSGYSQHMLSIGFVMFTEVIGSANRWGFA
jgi:hypothetical protein